MDKPTTIPGHEGASRQTALVPEADPVLLSLPPRRTDNRHEASEAGVDPCLEQLQVIETSCGPRVEAALLKDLLARSPGLGPTLADPFEVHSYHNPLAAVNAYKHRLHALRCEFVNVRLRLHELETQLNQSNYQRMVLEKHVQFLDATLTQMQASRAWKLTEKISRWHRLLSPCFGRIFAAMRGQSSGTR